MQMASRLKDKAKPSTRLKKEVDATRHKSLFLDCLTLSNVRARIIVLGTALFILCFVDIAKIGFPDFCIWEKIFALLEKKLKLNFLTGFAICPAHGTIRALNAFFKGRLLESIGYNMNVLVTAPLILFIFIKDLINFHRTCGLQKQS